MENAKKHKERIRPGTITQEIILVIATVIVMIPIFYFLIGAFKSRMDIIKYPFMITPKMFTLENFPYVIKNMKYLRGLLNTGIITAGALALVVFAGSLAGFAVARLRNRLFDMFYGLLVALMVVPFIGCVVPLVVMSVRMKLYNNLLGCILIQAGWNVSFAIFLYVGFMKGIPKELEEAAYLDGCNTFQVYWKIFLPMLKPVTATCLIRSGVFIWNDYLVSSSLLNSNKTPTLMVGIQQFFGSRATEYGYAFAGIVLASLPMVILFLCMQKNFISGLAAGAVKS